jgi:acetyl-CoA carboxylase carboxyltransferase component
MNRLPCIYLVDSGGANLPTRQTCSRIANTSSRIFYARQPQCKEASADRGGDGLVVPVCPR